MIGWMASSKAGHDKDKIYIIIEETQEYVYLADGKIRKVENPKKKKHKHVQVIKRNGNESLADRIHTFQNENIGNEKNTNAVSINEAIFREIKLYQKGLGNE